MSRVSWFHRFRGVTICLYCRSPTRSRREQEDSKLQCLTVSLGTALHALCYRFYRKSKDNSFLSLKRHYNQGAKQIIVEIPTLKPSCLTLFQTEKIKKGGKKTNRQTSIFAQATLE